MDGRVRRSLVVVSLILVTHPAKGSYKVEASMTDNIREFAPV